MSLPYKDRIRLNILFENVDDELFARILPKLHERHYRAGGVIVEDNTDGDELFLLVEGRVRVIKRTKSGDENLLALLHAGDFFGELELVDARPRSARVIAVEDCVAFSLKKADFDGLLEESHAFATRLMQVMSIRLRALNNHFVRELESFIRRSGAEMEKLQQLIDASKALNSTLDLGRLLDIILDIALKTTDGDRGTVYLVDRKKEELWSVILKKNQHVTIRLPYGRGIAGYVAASGDSLNIPDAYLDARFNPDVDRQTGYRTGTILCMPMKNKDGDTIGVFQLLNKRGGPFTAADENFISALSIHASLAIENARLYEEEKALASIREEVRLAAQIQMDLLPKMVPSVEGYELAGASIPAQMVGGDYFDFIRLEDGRMGVCLGDVSGKGMPAALLMANLQATLRGQTLLAGDVEGTVRRSNRLLYETTSPEKFVTLVYGALDPKQHTFRFTNAGHDHPCLFRNDGKPHRLESGGIVLGVLPDYHYSAETVEFHPGDVLVIYSDGICESMNADHEQFGMDRLVGVIGDNLAAPAGEILNAVVEAARHHAGAAPQYDDMTVVVVKRVR
ncbi:MAG TPA: SpoIIE family protein phosphatase [Bacteroidota bacterium]|nr:SpoIIE family protein phosphatase [Bacteroidota bacterium]